MKLREPDEHHEQVPRSRHFPALFLMQIQLADNGIEKLPQGIVLELIRHHRPGSDTGYHLGVVRPDERIYPEERISLAGYP